MRTSLKPKVLSLTRKGKTPADQARLAALMRTLNLVAMNSGRGATWQDLLYSVAVEIADNAVKTLDEFEAIEAPVREIQKDFRTNFKRRLEQADCRETS
jgi:hypothetical protein